MLTQRLRWIVVASLVGVLGCGGGTTIVDRTDAIEACYAWSDGIVNAYAPCQGWTADELAVQIEDGHDDCERTVGEEPETCADELFDAFERCAGDFDDGQSCDDLCPNGLCFDACAYACSEQRVRRTAARLPL